MGSTSERTVENCFVRVRVYVGGGGGVGVRGDGGAGMEKVGKGVLIENFLFRTFASTDISFVQAYGMVGEACLPSNAYYPQTPDYTLCSGVHVCQSEHPDSSFLYGFMSLDYGFGTMTGTTTYYDNVSRIPDPQYGI